MDSGYNFFATQSEKTDNPGIVGVQERPLHRLDHQNFSNPLLLPRFRLSYLTTHLFLRHNRISCPQIVFATEPFFNQALMSKSGSGKSRQSLLPQPST